MDFSYKKFVRAALAADKELALGHHLKIADIAEWAKVTIGEAQRLAQQMVDDHLAAYIDGKPDCLKLNYAAIKFALTGAA